MTSKANQIRELEPLASGGSILKAVALFVAWLGGAATAIGIILTASGYVVEHSYLATIGVPRSVYDARAIEYTAAGGYFLAGLVPLAVVGCAQFLLNCWWCGLILAGTGILAWKLKLTRSTRLLVFALVYLIWLLLILFQFQTRRASLIFPSNGSHLMAIFTFTNLLALAYLYLERLGAVRAIISRDGLSETSPPLLYVPFLVALVAGFLLMPYVRGTYAEERKHPTFEALGEGATYLKDLVWSSITPETKAPASSDRTSPATDDSAVKGTWQLIEIGEKKIILRSFEDGSIVVVPIETIPAFRLKEGRTFTNEID